MIPHAANLGEMGRRRFLQLLAASALATQGCAVRRELVPYVVQPEHASATFATSLPFRGFGRGVLVDTVNGRPLSLRGNPDHPASQGGADVFMFAALLDLYDPARRFGPGRPEPLQAEERVAFLSRPVRSPFLEARRQKLLERFPRAGWFEHDPWPAALPGFTHPVLAHPRLEGVVVSLEEDFLTLHPDHLRLAREFAQNRPELYVLESTPSPAGVKAYQRQALSPARIERFLYQLASRMGVHGGSAGEEVEPIASRLEQRGGVVLAGASLSPEAQVLAFRINQKLGRVTYSQETAQPGPEAIFRAEWDRLVVLDGNPFLELPGLPWESIPERLHLTLFPNETSQRCQGRVPLAHPLESWGDLRSYDGTLGLLQPLIEPLHGGVTAWALLGLLMGESTSERSALRPDPERLRRGFSPGQPARGTPVPVAVPDRPPEEERETVVLHRPDPNLGAYDWAHNGWLQELPRPVSKLCWGQAALIDPALAGRLQLENGDHLQLGNRTAPVWITPEQAPGCVTLWLGPHSYGREEGPIVRAPGHTELVCTQRHHRLEDPLGGPRPPETLYPHAPREAPAWGMVIDLGGCIGCNACVLACQAENNIPTVGAEQVAAGREMHWLRVDHYQDQFVPVPCMHCEDAPCERVCPVEATLHSRDGLNEMIYNRCVGTRYCSNNCPYKVRRFNFLSYVQPELAPLRNPEVTVRDRGVMEKCTYCVQRIRRAEEESRSQHRPMAPVTTACQDACPTRAITFGDLADPGSEVARLARDPRNFTMLAELNTRPRTTYLRPPS